MKGDDGTLWSALSGRAIEGPQAGSRLERIANVSTTWEHWLMLHPESTAYDLFDGERYPVAELPTALSEGARQTMGEVDPRLEPLDEVVGVEVDAVRKAYPLAGLGERAVITDRLADTSIAVFWYGPTRSAVVFRGEVDDRTLSLFADDVSPETAPSGRRSVSTMAPRRGFSTPSRPRFPGAR